MNIIKWILACTMVCTSATALGSNVEGITLAHYESLQRFRMEQAGLTRTAKPGAADWVTMRFDALGQSFQLDLEPNDRLFSTTARPALRDDVKLYRGNLAGQPESWVRIAMVDGMPSGLIWDGTEMYAVEAPGDSLAGADEPIIYRFADSFVAPGTLSCGSEDSSGTGTGVLKSLTGQLQRGKPQGPGADSQIDLGAIGDFEFTGEVGGDPAGEILARLNVVDGIFSEQLGVQLVVRFLETFADADDPFSDTTDAGDLINELTTYRSITPGQRNQGLTHLFTGRELDTSTVGLAFTGELCEPRFGAALTQGTHGLAFDSLIAAHEIGHNFGAPHDGVPGSVCEATPSTFLMATIVNSSDEFSACSIAEMQDDIAQAACITPIPSVEIGLLPTAQPDPVLLGNAATVGFDVINLGTTPAEDVEVEITLPGNFLYLSSAATGGSCSEGAGAVNCLLDDIAPAATTTVVVTTRTTEAGVGVFTAIASAPEDLSPANNQDIVQVTVNPAVNLSINPPAAAQVTVNQNTTVAAVLENLSGMDATDVTVSMTIDSGIRADSASWSIGACTVAAQQVDCQADSFDALSTSTIDLDMSATSTGQKNVTITISSSETDSDPSDNTIAAAVTVNGTSGSGGGSDGEDDDSGGGATGPGFLWLLGVMVLLARRRGAGPIRG